MDKKLMIENLHMAIELLCFSEGFFADSTIKDKPAFLTYAGKLKDIVSYLEQELEAQ